MASNPLTVMSVISTDLLRGEEVPKQFLFFPIIR